MAVLHGLLIFLLASVAFAQEEQDKFAVKAAVEAAIPAQKVNTSVAGTKNLIKIFTYSAAVACAGLSVYKHYGAQKEIDNINELKNNPPPNRYGPESERWLNQYRAQEDELRKLEKHRNIFGVTAIYLTITGEFFF